MSEELKPCPFCGSEDVYLEDASDKFGELWVIGCNKCFVALSAGSESSKGCVDATREQTIAAWNRRAKKLPEKHGRLIDADAFAEHLRESAEDFGAFAPQMAMALEAAVRDLEDPKKTPTIVEAKGEEGEE